MRHLKSILLVLTAILGLVHADEERPKIGLVLGGGGALGFAHVGVLRRLEELQIPIDCIAGTSMGSIVAGMYASGMSPDEIESAFLSLNWWDVLRDQSANEYLVYRRKVENKRYLGVEFGWKNYQIQFAPGMAHGQKLNNVLETFSINSVGITDFDQLNIPYRAVATDLRSGTPVILKEGSLSRAMRASMAVPGAFTPIQMDGMVLVDGGVLDNIPVDAVKQMGADIVIAVDVGASAAARGVDADYPTLAEVVSRAYNLMQRPSQERQLKLASLVISPELTGFSPTQFHKVQEIMPCGYEAACLADESLARYSIAPTNYAAYLTKQRAKHVHEVRISSVSVDGNETVSDAAILSHIRAQPGSLDLHTVYDDLSRIYGLGLFQSVTYELQPCADGYALSYHAEEKYWGPSFLHVGMKLETATDAAMIWSILLNYTRTQLNTLGGELRMELEGGGNIRALQGDLYQPVVHSGRFFVSPSMMLSIEDIDFYEGNQVVANIEKKLAYGGLDAGLSAGEYGEFRAGVLGGRAEARGNAGSLSFGREGDDVVAGTTHLRLDQLDDPVLPTSGYQLSVDGLFASEEIGSSQTFSRLEATATVPFTWGNHTLMPGVAAGSSLGTELPFTSIFEVGGLDGFAGTAPYQMYGNYYGIGRLSYRYRLGQLYPTIGNGIYGLLRIDAGNAWFETDEIDFNNINYGGLAGVVADTLLGSCYVAVGKAEGLRPRIYFSIGNTF